MSISYNSVRNKLDDLIRRENRVLSREENLEERLGSNDIDSGQVVEYYQEIIREVEAEEKDFEKILQQEKEKFREALKTAKNKARARRMKLELLIDFEGDIDRLKENIERFIENPEGDQGLKNAIDVWKSRKKIESDIQKIKELEENEPGDIDHEALTRLSDETLQAMKKLRNLVNHLQKESGAIDGEQVSGYSQQEVERCKKALENILENKTEIENIESEIEDTENLKKNQVEAEEIENFSESVEQNLEDLQELTALVESEEFQVNFCGILELAEIENPGEKLKGLTATLEKVEDIHEEFFEKSMEMSRRKFVTNSAKIMAGAYTASTAQNVGTQILTGTVTALNPPESKSEGAIRKAVKGRPVNVELIKIEAPRDNRINPANYNLETVFRKTEESFGEDLGIDINFTRVNNLILDPDRLETHHNFNDKDIREVIENVKREIIRGTPTDSIGSKKDSDEVNTDEALLRYLRMIKQFRVIQESNDSIKVVFTDFSGTSRIQNVLSDFGLVGGISSKHGSNTNEFIIMTNSGNQPWFTNRVAHEIAHKLGIPHTQVVQDVMSYGFFRRFGLNMVKDRPHFSNESRLYWSLVKKDML